MISTIAEILRYDGKLYLTDALIFLITEPVPYAYTQHIF